ncbi:MAG: DUF2878 family protein [Candidatus Woesearchaeota archaeon]|jgi:hypothetical protein|nr:DUF2878 family protein [Candidatus Woesearchaeota archaeon]
MNEYLKSFLTNTLSVMTLLTVAFLWNNPNLVLVLLIFYAFLILFLMKDKDMILIFFICGLMGAISEIIAISYGAWTYSKPNYFGIPIWLLVLWGIATLFMINFSKEIILWKKIIKNLF